MDTNYCGDCYLDSLPSPAPLSLPSVPTAAVAAVKESPLLTLLCIAFIVLFYGSIFLICSLIYPKLPKKPIGDEEAGDPLPQAIRYVEYGNADVKGGGIRAEECVICLEDFDEKQLVRVLARCRHAFHDRCIDSWSIYKSACPICRDPFRLPSDW